MFFARKSSLHVFYSRVRVIRHIIEACWLGRQQDYREHEQSQDIRIALESSAREGGTVGTIKIRHRKQCETVRLLVSVYRLIPRKDIRDTYHSLHLYLPGAIEEHAKDPGLHL